MSWTVDETILLPDPWPASPSAYACGWPTNDPGTLSLDYDLAVGSNQSHADVHLHVVGLIRVVHHRRPRRGLHDVTGKPLRGQRTGVESIDPGFDADSVDAHLVPPGEVRTTAAPGSFAAEKRSKAGEPVPRSPAKGKARSHRRSEE